MAPRRYRMDARAQGVEATRHRIIDAAKQLHAEQGVRLTSWDEIADAAGVAPATVYRHFPSLAELIPACAQSVFDLIQPPTVEEAKPRFTALESAADRFELLVRSSCHCFADGEGWLHAAHRERDFVPELDKALRVIDDTLVILVQAAAGRRVPKAVSGRLFVLCDFPFWKALIDRGVSKARAEQDIVDLVRAEIVRIGLEEKEPM